MLTQNYTILALTTRYSHNYVLSSKRFYEFKSYLSVYENACVPGPGLWRDLSDT